MVMVTGCKPPVSVLRPGRLTSIRSFSNFALSSACSHSAFLAFKKSNAACFASLILAPIAGRSSAATLRNSCISWVKCPFLPKYSTRISSNVAKLLFSICSIADFAFSTRSFRCCIVSPDYLF